MTWYKYKPGMFREYRNMSDEELGRFVRQLDEALAYEERGVNALADRLMEEREAFAESRRRSARARWEKANGKVSDGSASDASGMHVHSKCNANGMQVQCHTYIPTDTDHTDRQDKPIRPTDARAREGRDRHRDALNGPEPETAGRPEGAGKPTPTPTPTEPEPKRAAAMPPTATAKEREARWAELAAALEDHYALVAAVPDLDLAPFAAWACYEADNHRAVARYRGFIRKHGAAAFRRLLDEFLGECHAVNGEPESRARAFMARVTREERD